MRQEKLQYFMIDCQNKKNSGNLFDRELPIREAFSYQKMPVNCHNYLRKKLFFGNNNMIYYN